MGDAQQWCSCVVCSRYPPRPSPLNLMETGPPSEVLPWLMNNPSKCSFSQAAPAAWLGVWRHPRTLPVDKTQNETLISARHQLPRRACWAGGALWFATWDSLELDQTSNASGQSKQYEASLERAAEMNRNCKGARQGSGLGRVGGKRRNWQCFLAPLPPWPWESDASVRSKLDSGTYSIARAHRQRCELGFCSTPLS